MASPKSAQKKPVLTTMNLFYATNRNHIGEDRWHPSGYGTKFSDDGIENLRFGRLTLDVDEATVNQHLATTAGYGVGNGIGLSEYLGNMAGSACISAYEENIPDPTRYQNHQEGVQLGSQALFDDLKGIMTCATDVIIYIHGFNVSWNDAVGGALALQTRLNRSTTGDTTQSVAVVLFSWPSDGMALPFVSYKSDRTEASGSGKAFARGVLKLRDYLMKICKRGDDQCGQDIHLLCHSMGNYALQEALPKIADYSSGRALPRLFEHIFMCAPDVDADCFEEGKPLARLPELARFVTIYHNQQDKAMYVSDYTKGNPERLGCDGAAHPTLLNAKIHQVDCTPIVLEEGLVEHSYYLNGFVNDDIRLSTDGVPLDGAARRREMKGVWPNLWVMK
ncbi:MAG TPA: alpha/beta hydrolase [Desulfuromonadales bacterium]|nr:alpha/beta hydrolase [Desulfuromonadales bacterium]